MPCYNVYTCMVSHQYVYVYAFLENPLEQMPCYSMYTSMAWHLYGYVGV